MLIPQPTWTYASRWSCLPASARCGQAQCVPCSGGHLPGVLRLGSTHHTHAYRMYCRSVFIMYIEILIVLLHLEVQLSSSYYCPLFAKEFGKTPKKPLAMSQRELILLSGDLFMVLHLSICEMSPKTSFISVNDGSKHQANCAGF